MRITSKVSKMGIRKYVVVPKAARDNFNVGEEVTIEKVEK